MKWVSVTKEEQLLGGQWEVSAIGDLQGKESLSELCCYGVVGNLSSH